jgi:histidine triad (HIT) family protein
MKDCLFCRIIAGDVPAQIVYQDEHCVAFRDISPQAPVHVLIIPREHIESLDEASRKDEIELGRLLRVSARIANEEGLSEGYRVVTNNGALAGQSVFHLHFHLLGGRRMNWPPG